MKKPFLSLAVFGRLHGQGDSHLIITYSGTWIEEGDNDLNCSDANFSQTLFSSRTRSISAMMAVWPSDIKPLAGLTYWFRIDFREEEFYRYRTSISECYETAIHGELIKK